MRLKFLELPADERRLYFEQAALRRGLSPVILEKDFWVSWMLAVLFSSKFADVLVFKGGTSLSKVFGVIQRFSEDIDLSVAPEFLGMPDSKGGPSLSRNQAGKWMKKAEAACAHAVQEQLHPELERTIVGCLEERTGPWLQFDIDPNTNSPVLLFHYPTTQPDGFDYFKRAVKLEFGSLTDQKPVGHHSVRPWLADTFPSEFGDWNCDVIALELERTFWEKATILHSEHHRPADKPTPDRFSRHYADTAALALHPIAAKAIEADDLLDRVVAWKNQFFASSWARYDLAQPGTFKLVPPADRIPGLRRDYLTMRDMYLAEPMNFERIMGTLGELEGRINDEQRA
jgi:Nucleotidyl transferase AbiEii toxin, Type IV TA system